MKKKVFLILLLNLLLLNCFSYFENPILTEENDPKQDFLLLCFYGFGSSFKETYEVQDRNDGTLEVVRHYDTTSCFGLLNDRRTTSQYFIKKCIQGQVYREAENDCKGTGSADDYYGAQKYQFCPTNDTACDDNLSDRPAYASCIKDTTVNKTWMLAVFLNGDPYFEYVKTRNEEIPSSDSDYYWLNLGNTDNKARAKSLIDNSNEINLLKNTYLYVLCREY